MDTQIREYFDSLNKNPTIYLPTLEQEDVFDSEKYFKYLDAIDDQAVREIVTRVLESTIYIDFPTFLAKLRDLASQIEEPEFSILIDISNPVHSEVWCLVLIWDLIRDRVRHIFGSIEDVNDDYPLLLVDDCIYTGSRISSSITKISRSPRIKNRLKILICVPYAHIHYQGLVHIHTHGQVQMAEYAEEYTADFSKIEIACYYIANVINPAYTIVNGDYSQATVESNLLNDYFDTTTTAMTLPLIFQHKLAGPESTFAAIYREVLQRIPDRSYLNNLVHLRSVKKV